MMQKMLRGTVTIKMLKKPGKSWSSECDAWCAVVALDRVVMIGACQDPGCS